MRARDLAEETCSRCEEGARAVAKIVPELDQLIINDLEKRLSHHDKFRWEIDEDTQVPVCTSIYAQDYWKPGDWENAESTAECFACLSYVVHLQTAMGGFSTEAGYLADQRWLGTKDTCVWDEVEQVSRLIPHGGVPECLEPRDPELKAHMERLSLLKAIRGRQTMNMFLHEDTNTNLILSGITIALGNERARALQRRNKQQARVLSLRAELEAAIQAAEQKRLALAAIQDQRPRRIPNPKTPNDSPAHLTISQATAATGTEFPLARLSSPQVTAAEFQDFQQRLRAMKAPGDDQPTILFVRWLQIHKNHRIKGVPLRNDGAVDLRHVRGRNSILPLLPPGPRSGNRSHYARCLLALLRVLVIPGAYASLLQRHNIQVASEAEQSCLFENSNQTQPKEEEVAGMLANHGFTTDAALDCWPFCFLVLKAYQDENKFVDITTLRRLEEDAKKRLDDMAQPPEYLHVRAEDLVPAWRVT
ncbi:hypothetical protein FB45DRAFT_859287 [Roridomyces roridus]|uniref:Uncharacterized protein n=1 Tax=Roridomyces roridus TaxID=1738132 RepID=A0AAD7CJP7_9AGAR|nr:hypothetical protein FB45DRAFT_859287 [Roridomyces roridus]